MPGLADQFKAMNQPSWAEKISGTTGEPTRCAGVCEEYFKTASEASKPTAAAAGQAQVAASLLQAQVRPAGDTMTKSLDLDSCGTQCQRFGMPGLADQFKAMNQPSWAEKISGTTGEPTKCTQVCEAYFTGAKETGLQAAAAAATGTAKAHKVRMGPQTALLSHRAKKGQACEGSS